METYRISTDNMADLPEDYVKQHKLGMLSLSYMLEGVTYDCEHELPYAEFYKKMRNGSMPTTSQVNPETAKERFEEMLAQEEGMKILHIAFSSGLSGSYASAVAAAQEINEEAKEERVFVIDSLSASMGEGLCVHYALKNQEQGMSLKENLEWLQQNRLHICHNFTVEDLNHLYRGGRVSRATAILGTMANIKPLLHVDDEGHLVPVGKVRGRKKSLHGLVDAMEQQIGSYRDRNDVIFISHGDSYEDACLVKELIQKRFGYESFLINYVGPTIGTHSGPGTIALFYLGEYR